MPWTDATSFHDNNCVAIPGTNGFDLYAPDLRRSISEKPVNKFRQAPIPTTTNTRKALLNVMLDTTPQQDIVLPPGLTPQDPLAGSTGVVQFFLLNDKKTGVLALGSFSAGSADSLNSALLTGLQNLKDQGATQLIVDVVSNEGRGRDALTDELLCQSNNGGGFICVAHVSNDSVFRAACCLTNQTHLLVASSHCELILQI